MKALVLNEAKELNITDVKLPILGPDEVMVEMRSAALNHRELWISKGLYPGMSLPCVLGADGAGVIVDLGSNVGRDWLQREVIIYPGIDWGDDEERPLKQFRVLGMPDPGTMAQYIAVNVQYVFPKPKYLSWNAAAAIPVAGLTAWRSLTVHGKIRYGDSVLITGIGGGVAQMGLSFAIAHGAKVYVTSSSQEKIRTAISLGASYGVKYTDSTWPSLIKEVAKGISIVLDSAPNADLDDYLRFVSNGAKIVYYGSTAQRTTTFNLSKFFLRHISLIGTAMGSPRDFGDMITFMDKHEIQPVVDSVFSFDNSMDALQKLASGEQLGKVVVEIKK